MALPPLEAGAVKVSVACALLADTAIIVGAPGATGAADGTTVTAADEGLMPIEFRATTVHEYELPLIRPVTVSGEAKPVADPMGTPAHVAV